VQDCSSLLDCTGGKTAKIDLVDTTLETVPPDPPLTRSMSLKYEPSSEPLHISAK